VSLPYDGAMGIQTSRDEDTANVRLRKSVCRTYVATDSASSVVA